MPSVNAFMVSMVSPCPVRMFSASVSDVLVSHYDRDHQVSGFVLRADNHGEGGSCFDCPSETHQA